MTDLHTNQLLFLDTETTGTGPLDRLCQVAYTFEDKEVSALFLPPVPISVEAMSITHITNTMVANCEAFIGSETALQLATLLQNNAILVAHNADFDVEMLEREGITVSLTIDTFKLAHHIDTEGLIPRYALQYLRYYYGLEVADATAHDALGDVRVLRALFEYYFSSLKNEYTNEADLLTEMISISKQPILLKKFTFGKYSGQSVKKIAQEDPSYLAWLLNQKVMTRENGGEDDEHWIYTLDFYVNTNVPR